MKKANNKADIKLGTFSKQHKTIKTICMQHIIKLLTAVGKLQVVQVNIVAGGKHLGRSKLQLKRDIDQVEVHRPTLPRVALKSVPRPQLVVGAGHVALVPTEPEVQCQPVHLENFNHAVDKYNFEQGYNFKVLLENTT